MPVTNTNAYEMRIRQVVFGFLFVGAVAVAVRSLMFGSFSRFWLIVCAFAGTGVVIALGKRYWLLLPILATSNFSVPGLRFNGPELGCLIMVAVHFLRLGLKEDEPAVYNLDLLLAVPVFFWILFVFVLNPVGLAMFGSDTIGGRFYFQIFVSFFALIAMSTQRVDEAGAKLLFYAVLTGMLYSLGRGVLFPRVDPDEAILLGDAAEASSRYAFTGCANIYTLLFARWALSDILVSPSRLAIMAVLSVFTIYSGKRRSFGTLALVPFIRVFLEGKQKALTALMTGLGVFVMVFAIAGDKTLYRLPRSARRALSVVVPAYETDAAAGMQDYFREHMREQARFIIRESPWLGRKGFAMNYKETEWMNFGGSAKTDLYVGHAYAGNWHSAWYAFAADFGLPCMVLWGFFILHVIRFAYRACRTVTTGIWLPTCCLYFSFRLLVDIAFSYTSGHSATTSMTTWIPYGILLAIVGGYRQAHPVRTP